MKKLLSFLFVLLIACCTCAITSCGGDVNDDTIEVQRTSDDTFVGGGLVFKVSDYSANTAEVYEVSEEIDQVNYTGGFVIPTYIECNGERYTVTEIGDMAFLACYNLTSVTIPASVTTISRNAFTDCGSLTSVTIPDPVTTIGAYAFFGCSSLTSITLPASLTTIGDDAFLDCCGLTSITIPDSVTTIGSNVFANCNGLISITIPNSVTEIGNNVFSRCSSLTSFDGQFASEDNRCLIVDGVLNSFAPAGLESYTIPCSVTEIGEGAFAGFDGLMSVTIPASVTKIGNDAFLGCSNLISVTIGSSVTTIGDGAFSDCRDLASFTSLNPTPPTVDKYTFYYSSISTCVLRVPASAVAAYRNAGGWKEFSHIEGI